MVDLDSNPTKLIEVVEIGKQLLITRGALTTFSIANDVAKYFAIIPAMFAGVFPALDRLNIMRLDTPRSAILSAVIFNALIIVALIPLALRGVKFRAPGAAAILRRNLLIYGVGGLDRPVHRHQGHRPRHHRPGSATDAPPTRSRPAHDRRALHGRSSASPTRWSMTGVGQVAFGHKANGSLVKDATARSSARRSSARRSPSRRTAYFQPRPSAAGRRATTPRRSSASASNLGPDQPEAARRPSPSASPPTGRRTGCRRHARCRSTR